MFFGADHTGPALPAVIEAVARANTGYMPSYGDDPLMEDVRTRIRTLFEAPQAAVYLVATGTAANVLALATLAQPWQTIFCAPLAHINVDECNGPEFYTGGAKLTLVGDNDKMTPDALSAAISKWPRGDVHAAQRGPVHITQVTERGRVYSLDEIKALTEVARAHDLPTYLDGARFTNAMVALDCSPAEMSWKSGIDALSLGGTKNGCMGVEAVIFFDPGHAWEFELRRKRGAHLFSKHRYLSAQMQGYLAAGNWTDAARRANAGAARLVAGLRDIPDLQFLAEPQANMIFATLPRRVHQMLHDAGAVYGLWGDLEGDADERLMMRLVTDWSITDELIDQFLGLFSS